MQNATRRLAPPCQPHFAQRDQAPKATPPFLFPINEGPLHPHHHHHTVARKKRRRVICAQCNPSIPCFERQRSNCEGTTCNKEREGSRKCVGTQECGHTRCAHLCFFFAFLIQRQQASLPAISSVSNNQRVPYICGLDFASPTVWIRLCVARYGVDFASTMQ
jgi:hypothetical protein